MTTTETTRIFCSERLGDTLIVTPLTDLGEVELSRIERDGDGVVRMFELAQIKNVVIDLERADFTGSSALNFFLRLWKQTQTHGGKLAFCHVSPHALSIFQVCRLDTIWPIYDSRAEAFDAVRDHSELGSIMTT